MFASKISRFWPVPLSLLALNLAAGCGDSGSPPSPSVTGGSGPGAGTGGTGAGSSGSPAGGNTSTSGSGGAQTGGTRGAPTPGTGGPDSAGTGGSGGTAGSGGGGTGLAACNTAPADPVPELERGPAITGFDGMMTAGQIIGAPGEADIFYVIGHRDGNVFIVQNGAPAAEPLIHVDVASGGNNEQGLLSMAFHPDFATNHLFYLYYTAPGDGALTVDEFIRMTPTTAMFMQNIFSTPRATNDNQFHNGGELAFDPTDATKSLFLSTGNTSGNDAGDAEGTLGRVLQIDVASKAYDTYIHGFRNPYRMSIDRLTGDMYIGDAANGAGGTIILHEKGDATIDYGYRDNNGNPDVNDGIHRETGGAAIIGGVMYRGSAIPGLCGRYFFGTHSDGTIKSAVVQNGAIVGQPFTHDNLTYPGDLTSFGEDGVGELYMAGMDNTIYKIQLAQ